ncbi:MAG TPA: FliH/SctL family protein [Steroidobacteraceae bacterium]|nr:FliH/SctL family protein [Steroidobacteraceae bacterium]
MDALIRSASLAPFRTRLSEAPTRAAAVSAVAQTGNHQRHGSAAAPETLRAELEKQLRAELAAQMQKVYESECARARTAGRAAAQAEAQAAAAQELQQAREQLEGKLASALSAMQRSHEELLARLEASVGEIAFAAVCRIAGAKAASRAFVMGMVEQTCAQLRADTMATARLHPRDLETLRELMQDHELRIQSLGLKVIADESLELGGCVLEAASGQYDGGLDVQLRRLHAALAGSAERSADVEGA